MGKRSAAGLLTSVDSIFTTQEERDNAQRSYVTDLSAAEISDFPNHPFKVRMDQSMVELADSVKQYGVLVPSLVRPMPDGSYQMVSGHRRKRAAELAGLPTVPCIIRELTDDEAIIVMVDSNLQREQILPSEKAVAYKMKLEAMKRQGMRTDLTFGPLGQKSAINTRDTLATEVPDSSRQIQRYPDPQDPLPWFLRCFHSQPRRDHGGAGICGREFITHRPAVRVLGRRLSVL